MLRHRTHQHEPVDDLWDCGIHDHKLTRTITPYLPLHDLSCILTDNIDQVVLYVDQIAD